MAEAFSHSEQWNLKHICFKTSVLPNDFFSKSIFGKSITINELDRAECTPSDLKIGNFKQAGFPLDVCTALEYGLVSNHASAMQIENREFVIMTLNKWEHMGVFDYVGQRPYIVNPLSVVTTGQKKRLVLDARGLGLNDFIIAPKFVLPNMGDVMLRLHKDDYMIKLDLANGFSQLPVRKPECTFLGFQNPIDGRFAVLKRLHFGLSSAPFLFFTFTHALKQGAKQVLNVHSEVYIDWFLSNASLSTLNDDYNQFTNFLSFLGVAIQHEKTEGPSQAITYLGLTINTLENRISLPEAKRLKYLTEIQELLQAEVPTMEQLAKNAGRLVHISFVHRAGAGNVQPLWNVLYKERKEWTKLQLEREGLFIEPDLLHCLQWWVRALSHENLQRIAWMTPTKQLFL